MSAQQSNDIGTDLQLKLAGHLLGHLSEEVPVSKRYTWGTTLPLLRPHTSMS